MKSILIAVLSTFSIFAFGGCQWQYSHDKKNVDIDINATLASPIMTKEVNSTIPVLLFGTATNDDAFGDCANHKIVLVGTARPNLSKVSIDLNITSIACTDVNEWYAGKSMFILSNVGFAVETAPIEKKAILITKKAVAEKALKAIGSNQTPELYMEFLKEIEPAMESADNNPIIVNIKTIQRQR